MAEYVKVVDLLDACTEVEYLGRPRMMVSASKIAQLPSVEINEFEWIDDGFGKRCSNCGFRLVGGEYKFCPECGSRRKVEK